MRIRSARRITCGVRTSGSGASRTRGGPVRQVAEPPRKRGKRLPSQLTHLAGEPPVGDAGKRSAPDVLDEGTAFLTMGEDRASYLVEQGRTVDIFTNPRNQLTEDYVSGRFG